MKNKQLFRMMTKDEERHPAPLGSIKTARTAVIAQFERKFVIELLRSLKGNVSAAARTAGMTRQNFQRLMKKYGIQASMYRHREER